MAYRRSNGKGRRTKKVEPAVKTMLFVSPSINAGADDQFYIDLSQCASLMNRRFYRQGINWAVQSIKVMTTAFTGLIYCQKLPETWIMSNAWMKGFKAWQKMNDEALEEAESVRPRFLDFKIYADAQHHSDGYGANLLPYAFPQAAGAPEGATPAVVGEWESSKYRIPVGPSNPGDTTEREVIAVGPSFPGAGASGINAVSLIEGYAASRGLPDIKDPNAPGDADNAVGLTPENWISALFNEGTEQASAVLADMIDENNIAPYPFENDGVHTDTMYPGGANQLGALQLHDQDNITATTVGGMTTISGGLFPCGLIKLSCYNTGGAGGNLVFQVNLVPGHHRGYLCEPMTEM